MRIETYNPPRVGKPLGVLRNFALDANCIMENLKNRDNEFDDALEYSGNEALLDEKQRFYCESLIAKGFTVKFNEKKIFNRKNDGIVISISRENLRLL